MPSATDTTTGPRIAAPWLLVAAGALALYVPTLYSLFSTVWGTDEQGHGPIILGLSIWLLYRSRSEWFVDPPAKSLHPLPGWAYSILLFSGLCYVLGRSQSILFLEVGSSLGMIIGTVLLLRGPSQLRAIWFPLFFMVFMVPLPSVLVDMITQPMKTAVSHVAELVLYAAGYPIARSGVVLQIGPYQLLVADACAGLHTLFTLEALGLFYLNVVRHSSAFRNVALAVLIVPISFFANVVRVMALTLVTYHLGDAAGQGFLHGFAGMVLFLSALILILLADSLLRLPGRRQQLGTAAS